MFMGTSPNDQTLVLEKKKDSLDLEEKQRKIELPQPFVQQYCSVRTYNDSLFCLSVDKCVYHFKLGDTQWTPLK